MLHNTPRGLPNRLPCLTSFPPSHVPPIIFPLQRKARGAICEAHRIYGLRDCENDNTFTYPNKHYPPTKSTWYHLWNALDLRGLIYIRNSPLKAHLRALIPPIVEKKNQSHESPCGPVCTKKTQKSFGFTRLFDLNMKIYFKIARGERLRLLSRANLRRYIVYHLRLSTLPGRKQTSK